MQNRKNQKRTTLNSMRITLLDWDPMDLFLIGQAGLEEYDEYLVLISNATKRAKNLDELIESLTSIAEKEMDAKADPERTKIAAEKLLQLNLD